MAQQVSEPTTREVRQLFGKLYDQAAGLAESLRPCRCGATRGHVQDDQDPNAIVQELLPVRQRVGGCICGPPCDGTSVDHASDEFLGEMLAGLMWDYSVLDENLVPCDCDKRPEVVKENPPPLLNLPRLLRLPPEIRNLIWWMVLGPGNGGRGFVRVVQRLLNPDENIPDLALQRPRSSIDMGGEPPHALTFERQDERLQEQNPRGRWALLWVNRQIRREAENEFWRRTVTYSVLSFMPDPDLPGQDHYGILAAWAWFHNYRGLYRQQIRRLQLNLARPARFQFAGADVQDEALEEVIRGTDLLERHRISQQPFPLASSNGVDFLDDVLDAVGDLPNLQELSVTIGGLAPELRYDPPLGDEIPPWVTSLQNIRGLTRLRLRVIFTLPAIEREPLFNDPSALDDDEYVSRAEDVLWTLRDSMLVNGQALASRHIRSRATTRVDGSEVIVVECDDSWDEETQRHIQHREGDNPDERSWDDGDLI